MRYRVGEFAALTGVTVRALQHYDRLGLLRVARTESGHRVYSDADRQRVRHILALRTIGMSLHHIADLLKGPASQVPDALRLQRATLVQSRIAVDEAIELLRQMEEQGSGGAGPLLDRLADGVEMQDALEAMRGYFSDEAWEKWGQHYFQDWPSAAWRTLFRDVEASLEENPAGERAQELLNRSKLLWDTPIGSDPQLARAVREGYGKAWQARERWPSALRRRYAEFQIDEIAQFLGAAQMASWRRRGLIHTYTARRSAG
jgi:MerR family transcriptional regulator, thiopeptide resistance regulator